MSLANLLRPPRATLTKSDRRLVEVLHQNSRDIPFMSAAELGALADVDPATVVRFARKLGYSGYAELRTHLQQEMLGLFDAAERMRTRIAHVGSDSILKSYVQAEIRNLNRLAETVTEETLSAAAHAIIGADCTFLFSVGHGGALTYLLRSRLSRLGHKTQSVSAVGHDAAIEILQARKDDVFLIIGLDSVHPLAQRIVIHAREISATSILITDLTGKPMKPMPDIILSASRGPQDEPRSLTVPMALCNAIILHASRMAKNKTIKALERLDRVRRQLEIPE